MSRLWRKKAFKVVILGASGGIGEALAAFIKADPKARVRHLALYDIANMGMAVDLAHIPTPTKVKGFARERGLSSALTGADVVVIPADVQSLDSTSAIVQKLATACAKHCPSAHLILAGPHVNSTVPIAYETLRAMGISSPNVFGITSLHIIRARLFIGELRNIDPCDVTIKVVGGYSGPTAVPLLSTTKPNVSLSDEEARELVRRIQHADDEVFEAKAGTGSATLGMGYATKEFLDTFLAKLDGDWFVPRPTAFVRADAFTSKYFSSQLDIESGTGIIKTVSPMPANITGFEKELLEIAMGHIASEVREATQWLEKQPLEE